MSETPRQIGAGGTDSSGWEAMARSAASEWARRDANEMGLPRELLVFGLAGSDYAIAVDRVREIVRVKALTSIPRSPEWLLGVVMLRGEVVEVIDLRLRLGLDTPSPTRNSRIIVLHGDAERVAGVWVDCVREVIRVPEDRIVPSQGPDTAAVVEMCRRDEGFISILDVGRALGVTDD